MLYTVNIVNIHGKHKNKLEIKSVIENADDFNDEIDKLGLQRFSVNLRGKILLTQP